MFKLFSKVLTLLLVTLLIINIIPFTMVLADEDNEREIIRVGYTENYCIVKSPYVSGSEGYGYEYLRKMEEYIDYEFEFVLCDWSNALDMLRAGELDILPSVNKTQSRLDEFYFTENVFSKEIIVLFSKNKIYLDEKSYNALDGKNVGVQKDSSFAVILDEFVSEHNISPNIDYLDISNYSNTFRYGDYDYLLTSSLQMETNLNIALDLGTELNYIMATSQELIDQLNYAMEQIEKNNYMFKEDLHNKYFKRDIGSNVFISDDELSLIQDTPYDVGVINMYKTFGYTNEKEIHNVSVDVLGFISELLDIDINYIEISTESTKEELDKLDFYIYLNGYETDLYENHSVAYMEDNLLLIQNKGFETNTSVGVIDYYSLDVDVVSELTKLDDITFYPSVRALIDDFEKGNVSSILLANSVYELIYVLIKQTDHMVVNLSYPILPTIIYTDDFPDEKIYIIDKAISYLTDDDINTMLLNNLSLITEVEKKRIYNNYFLTVLAILVALYVIVKILKYNRQKEVERVADYDRLTELYTQQKFIKETRKLLNQNPNTEYTMYSFDIDNFKYINELYGFESGDNILKVIGNFLKETLTLGYPVSRLSSDHFILITKTNSDLKEGKIDDYLNGVLNKRISSVVGGECNICYSIGLYFIGKEKIDVEQMIDYCNMAREYSKEELGSVVTIYSDLMKQKEDVKNDIVHRMVNALNDKEFVLYYQAKFDVLTLKIVGAEALVRWFTDGKMMPPNDFIPLFEKNGFIEKLDYYVLETACEFLTKNKHTTEIPTISINLSSVTIMKNDVIERIVDILDKYSLEYKCIELEITESAFVDQFDVALQRINDLRSKGFSISMDDFGTGVSSLGRLKNMEIDVLKIDREFIIETLENHKSDVILKNVIQMANQLDLETLVEGIETEEQLDFLRENGCDVGQGYYFARPLPEDEFIKLLKK